MSVAIAKPMRLDEFLQWEELQAFRYEFDGFEPIAMTGGMSNHSAIQVNISIAIGARLRGKPCRLFNSDLKVLVAGSIRYPDASVVCTPVAPDATVITEPVVIFEVLSPSTASTDLTVKNLEYRDTPSIQRYVILAQDSQHATIFERAGGDWVGHVLAGDATLTMPEIGTELSLAEFYDGIDFGNPGPADDPSGSATITR
jgi:Uma2 family endonuclease